MQVIYVIIRSHYLPKRTEKNRRGPKKTKKDRKGPEKDRKGPKRTKNSAGNDLKYTAIQPQVALIVPADQSDQ